TLCYSVFDFKRRTVVMANSGLPYPIRATADLVSRVELPGVPLGSFAGSSYEELTFDLAIGDVFVFLTDGLVEAADELGRQFGDDRLLAVIAANRGQTARTLVDAIFSAHQEFRSGRPADDDMTAVVLRITA